MLKVKVNDSYAGSGWYDPKSKLDFTKSEGVIEISEDVDKSNINRYIRLNYLLKIEDGTDTVTEEEQARLTIQTPAQLLAEDKEKMTKETIEEVIQEVTEEDTSKELAEEIKEPDELEEPEEEAKEAVSNEKEACKFCGKKYSPKGLANHEKSCKKNPDNK